MPAKKTSSKTTDDLKNEVEKDLQDLKTLGEDTSQLGFQALAPAMENTSLDLNGDERPTDDAQTIRNSSLGEVERTVSKPSSEELLKAENARLKAMLMDRQSADANVGATDFEKQVATQRAARNKSPELRILPLENHKLSHNRKYWNLKKNVPIYVTSEAAVRAVNAKVATLI